MTPELSQKHISLFQQDILHWFEQYGRKSLPWQLPATPYRVWVSEIMLQQTQVETVIPYFERFMQNFPELADLAKAELDQILHLWSGLGYYARGRNLHKTAQLLAADFAGKLPQDLTDLQTLPGIGRSTAGAILSLGHNKSAAILDGNVKRVLARYFNIEGWPGKSQVLKQLWTISEQLTPRLNSHYYNQAMMDMGATVCSRSQPGCDRCPLSSGCEALKLKKIKELPGKKPKKIKPVREQCFLWIENKTQQVLLIKRPPSGIWGGLWSLPQASDLPVELVNYDEKNDISTEFTHEFTHFRLQAKLKSAILNDINRVMDDSSWIWYDRNEPAKLGLPTPILKQLKLDS